MGFNVWGLGLAWRLRVVIAVLIIGVDPYKAHSLRGAPGLLEGAGFGLAVISTEVCESPLLLVMWLRHAGKYDSMTARQTVVLIGLFLALLSSSPKLTWKRI